MPTMNPKTYWLVSLVCLAATSPATANQEDEAERWPLTRLVPPESREAPAQINIGASPPRSTTPITPRVESYAAAPPQVSPTRMKTLGRRAAKHVDYGFALAARGAVFSAEAEFIQSLALIAESRDETTGTRHHTRALEAGLTAVDEANDFVPDDAQLRPELDVSMILAGHRTPVMRDLPRDAVEAYTVIRIQQEYYAFAQDRLLQAVGHHSDASQAFYALARLQDAICKGPGGKPRASGPRSLLLHRLALMTDEQNYKAANEIGVLLTHYGMLEEARRALIHSLSLAERPQSLFNLSVVLERLGDRQAAAELRSRAEDVNHGASLRASEVARNVDWTRPEDFDEGTVYLASQAGALSPGRAKPRFHTATTQRPGVETDSFNWFPWKRR